MWRGEFAELDAKAEAKRIGGTCVAYALYTTPKRPWVGLTDDEVYKIAFSLQGEHWRKIADAIEKLVNNNELRDQLGSAAQEFTTANFGVQRLVSDHENLYKKLLANRARS
jgi:glycosyltransferase involved in cell wall biosynthesis